jgi:hypothetical protein
LFPGIAFASPSINPKRRWLDYYWIETKHIMIGLWTLDVNSEISISKQLPSLTDSLTLPPHPSLLLARSSLMWTNHCFVEVNKKSGELCLTFDIGGIGSTKTTGSWIVAWIWPQFRLPNGEVCRATSLQQTPHQNLLTLYRSKGLSARFFVTTKLACPVSIQY